MVSPTTVIKSVGPKLVPFFKTAAVYFVLFIPEDRPSWLALVIKCLPILSLLVFVLLHGMSLGDEYSYARRIMLGLSFCMLGDALLVFPGYFLEGMAAFAVGHVFYVAAFGFKPLNPSAGAVLYGAGAAGLYLLMPGADGVFVVGLPLYALALITMVWRAIARVQLLEDFWTWTKLCSCIGGICFVISDTLIGFHVFYGAPYIQAAVMVLYYAAQMGIALSVVDSKASYLDARRRQRELLTSAAAGVAQ
ncbi:lysoplasmalogenase-like protein TMEM86A [Pollicipes pollicipes]|uniref:lysoplasmalogenase-like protein TMEM86A n=1 Tax=Pollicipes pollicipes TaxID=41117 RepID=UPI0018857CB2|nr:lysoplasmalogenase-like protein TMEM86A [Pollicipes pollicipes]XP_037076723.1 lysoplasmalogenase-like protein TMEM86A [Pollicipes pollicipes]